MLVVVARETATAAKAVMPMRVVEAMANAGEAEAAACAPDAPLATASSAVEANSVRRSKACGCVRCGARTRRDGADRAGAVAGPFPARAPRERAGSGA
jgi:hypothetical protein